MASPNIEIKINIHPLQTFPKNWRGGNTSQLILWSQPDTEARLKYCKERKLQTNILDEHRCKHPPQNTGKMNSVAY